MEHLLYWPGSSPEGIQLTHTYLLRNLLHLHHLLEPVQGEDNPIAVLISSSPQQADLLQPIHRQTMHVHLHSKTGEWRLAAVWFLQYPLCTGDTSDHHLFHLTTYMIAHVLTKRVV